MWCPNSMGPGRWLVNTRTRDRRNTDIAAIQPTNDQAILGSGVGRAEGGYAFRLLVYDRGTDSITIDRQRSSTGALDMFDVTDTLVGSLLNGLSGTHLLFGSLTVDTDPAGATVAINGRDAGSGPLSVRGLPVGTVQIAARLPGHDDAQQTMTIGDGETANVSLKPARTTGKLRVRTPDDVQVTVVATRSDRGSSQRRPLWTFPPGFTCFRPPGTDSRR